MQPIDDTQIYLELIVALTGFPIFEFCLAHQCYDETKPRDAHSL